MGEHLSGAEKIVSAKSVSIVAEQLVRRAFSHERGVPDFVNLKIEAQPADIQRLKALPVTTHVTHSPEEGRAVAARLLRDSGVDRADEILAMFSDTHALRGAMLLDVDTLDRLEPDQRRGVRATYMDAAWPGPGGRSCAKDHYSEAVVLATKVQHAPGIVAEVCVSDDPGYVTGYVATRQLGYNRITVVKEKGDPRGGRIFLYRGPREGVADTLRYLEKTPVLVTDVPSLGAGAGAAADRRFAGLEHDLTAIRQAGLFRRCRTLEGATGPTARVDGRTCVVLASNDYLDLARDQRVISAAAEAARRWAAGSGGARLTTGTQIPHVRLEQALARFKGSEAALVYGTGYMANIGVISALAQKGDAVFSDELNHASIIDGCRLSGADVFVYRHLDLDDLDEKLRMCKGYRRRVVVSDGVFSMDGDVLDLPRYLEVTRRHDAFSVVDEAHATGVVGKTGRGLSEFFSCPLPDVLVGTLSKALGSEGGFVCASNLIVDFLRNKSRSFIFSTAPGAPAVAAAQEALAVLEEEPLRVENLRRNVAFFVGELERGGIVVKSDSAIVPIRVGDERKALAASAVLEEKGFVVPAIRYPTVAHGAARLRVAIMSSHSHRQLAAAARVIAETLGAL